MREEFSLEIPNDPQYVSVARLALAGLASRLNIPEEDVEDIKVCLSEACNAIIENGTKKEQNIAIHLGMGKNGLYVQVETAGNGLDEKVWEERHEMGKTFVENLMDEVKYVKGKSKGTAVEMVKYFDGMSDIVKYKH